MVQKKTCSAIAQKAMGHTGSVRRDCNRDAAKDVEAYESWGRFCLSHPDALLTKAAAIAAGQAMVKATPLDNNSILILQILERQAAFGF